MGRIQTIVVPHDFSDYAEAALDIGRELASALGAELHLVHVLQPPAYAYSAEIYSVPAAYAARDDHATLRLEAERRLKEIAEDSSKSDPPIFVHVVDGTRIAETIDEEAARLVADLIVMGTHGRTGLAHLLRGSVTGLDLVASNPGA